MNLKELEIQIKKCQKCKLYKTRKNAVPGEGNSEAKIFFIGEAPGSREDKEGRPFCGPSGKILDQLLNQTDIKRSSVFITSVLKCFPPKARDPKKEEIKACLPYLLKQIEIIKPKIIVCLGRFALSVFLPDKEISKVHGRVFYSNLKAQTSKLIIFPTFHPAASMRFPNIKKKSLEDFKKLKRLIREKK